MKTTQVCKACGNELPLTPEFFVRNCLMKNGFRIICKVCLYKQKKIDYDNVPKEIMTERQHNSYSKYKEVRKQKSREYYKNNRKKAMLRAKCKRQNNPLVRLSINYRNRINGLIKRNVGTHLEDLVGCSLPELKQHLENQFKENMDWSNWGIKGWHIDHIKPCSSFNLLDESEQKKCFHYTNLQPLWWYENISKRNKI